jgi:hypothetical protein
VRHRTVSDVGIAVKVLGIAGLWDQGIGRGEAAQRGQVKTPPHVDEADAITPQVVLPVPGEAAVGNRRRRCGAVVAEGQVASSGRLYHAPRVRLPLAIGQEAGAAQVVSVEVEQAVVAAVRVVADSRGDGLPTHEVGAALDGGRGHPALSRTRSVQTLPLLPQLFLVGWIGVVGEGALVFQDRRAGRFYNSHDPLPVSVIGEGRPGIAAAVSHLHQPVLDVEVLIVTNAGRVVSPGAHVAVGIVVKSKDRHRWGSAAFTGRRRVDRGHGVGLAGAVMVIIADVVPGHTLDISQLIVGVGVVIQAGAHAIGGPALQPVQVVVGEGLDLIAVDFVADGRDVAVGVVIQPQIQPLAAQRQVFVGRQAARAAVWLGAGAPQPAEGVIRPPVPGHFPGIIRVVVAAGLIAVVTVPGRQPVAQGQALQLAGKVVSRLLDIGRAAGQALRQATLIVSGGDHFATRIGQRGWPVKQVVAHAAGEAALADGAAEHVAVEIVAEAGRQPAAEAIDGVGLGGVVAIVGGPIAHEIADQIIAVIVTVSRRAAAGPLQPFQRVVGEVLDIAINIVSDAGDVAGRQPASSWPFTVCSGYIRLPTCLPAQGGTALSSAGRVPLRV